MLKKENVKLLIIAFLLFLLLCNLIYKEKCNEIKATNNYYSYSKKANNYLATLEIPNISLKADIFSINSIENNVDYNVQILKQSVMPEEENSIVILAAHSGNSSIAYFDELENLNIDDEIFFYYNEKKYTYHITNSYLEKKNGIISIPKQKDLLVLTTCSQKNKGYQFIVLAKMIDINK